jgi:hypothetical protein
LKDLQHLHIPRPYAPNSHSKANHKEICVFSDASTKAIGAVAYLRPVDGDGQISIGFILGKAKLTPKDQPTIPRLELCAAVLAVEVAELIVQEIDFKPDAITFYCDSKIVLGYIYNETGSTTGYRESDNFQNQSSGDTYPQSTIPLTLLLDLSMHLNS